MINNNKYLKKYHNLIYKKWIYRYKKNYKRKIKIIKIKNKEYQYYNKIQY